LKFLPEKPADIDLLDGQGHELVADTIAEELLSDNSEAHIIGLDGDLGSGKSTVINRIKEKVLGDDNQVLFIEFDVELYHNNNVNKALINTLYDKLKYTCWFPANSQQKSLLAIRNKALGRIVEYERNVTSKFSSWAVIFALIILFLSELTGDVFKALVDSLKVLPTLYDLSSWSWNLKHILALGVPVFVLGIYVFQFRKHVRDENGSSVSVWSVFDKKVPESIKDVFDTTNDIGSYELDCALEEFIAMLPDKCTVALIIDNLDRVPSQAFSQVWSDLEVFTHRTTKSFRLLIPFSSRHVAAAIVAEPEEPINSKKTSSNYSAGQEFISKRIPIVFRVANSVSADWHKLLRTYLATAGVEFSASEVNAFIQLVKIWLRKEEQVITPRFLKYKVNEIVSILKVHRKCDDISALHAWAYVNIMQFKEFDTNVLFGLSDIDKLLESCKEESSEESELRKFSESLTIIQALGHSRLEIYEAFAKIHYQTADGQVALSELLEKDIASSYAMGDFKRFLNRNRYFYKDALSNFLESTSVHLILKFLSEIYLLNENGESELDIDQWLNNYFSELLLPILLSHSHFIEGIPRLGVGESDNELFIQDVDSLIVLYPQLAKLGLVEEDLELWAKSIYEHLFLYLKVADNENIIGQIDPPLIRRYYVLGEILDIVTDVAPIDFAPASFLYYVWPSKNTYESWKEYFDLEDSSTFKGLLHALAIRGQDIEPVSGKIRKEIRSQYKLGSFPLFEQDSDTLEYLEELDTEESDYITRELYHQPERVIYSRNYVDRDSQFYNSSQLRNSYDSDWTEEATAFALIYSIKEEDYHTTDFIIKLANSYGLFNQDVFDSLLLAVPDFDLLMQPLVQGHYHLEPILTNSLDYLIRNKLVHSLYPLSLIGDYYSILKSIFSNDIQLLLRWMSGWREHIDDLEVIEFELIEDLINEPDNSLYYKVLELFKERSKSIDWEKVLLEPSELDYLENRFALAKNKSIGWYASFANELKRTLIEGSDTLPDSSLVKGRLMILNSKGVARICDDFNELWADSNTALAVREWLILFFKEYIKIPSRLKKEQQTIIIDTIENTQEAEVIEFLCGEADKRYKAWGMANRERLKEIVNTYGYESYFEKFKELLIKS